MVARSTESRPREQLHVELVGDREIVMTRSFAAPRALVFDIWTTPEHVRMWWCPPFTKMTMVECEIDLRVGGTYRYLGKRPDGFECGFRGEYREVTRPSRLVHTEEFDGAPGQPALITVTFEERDGRTTLRMHSLFPSAEARTMAAESGMADGVRACMDTIDDLIAAA